MQIVYADIEEIYHFLGSSVIHTCRYTPLVCYFLIRRTVRDQKTYGMHTWCMCYKLVTLNPGSINNISTHGFEQFINISPTRRHLYR